MNATPPLDNKINSIIELYSSGHISEALDTVQTLISQYPNEALLHNIGGVCFKATGQLEMAVQSFKSAVAIKSDFADAHYNLGLTFQELNQLEAAIKSYQVTLGLQNSYFKAHNNLGIIYKELGQLDESVNSYEKALKIQPDFAEAYNNLGNTLNELDKFDDSVKAYEEALKIQPDYLEVWNNLGKILNKIGQIDKAVKCYEKAIAINPEYAEAHNNLGVTLTELSQLHEAVKCYEKAIAINLDYDEAYLNLGIALEKLGQSEEALNSYEQALVINPDCADAYNNIGYILRGLGQLDEAFSSYVHALAIDSENTKFHRNLALMKNYTKGDTQFIQMQSLLSANNLNQSERANLCFALAKAYADLGEKDELFKVLNEGNQLRKEELNYSIEKDLNNHSLLRKIFKSSIKESSYKSLTIRPIFIVGMPRSGTSLVEQIISSHHKVHGAGELPTLNNLVAPILNNYLSSNHVLSKENFLLIREEYSYCHLSNLNTTESFITDKMPANFENIGFILKAFPEAKVVHLKRDAMAICWSIYQRYFPAEGLGFPYDMEDLGRFYNSYTEMMTFWHKLFPNQIYDISYEDLTTNQEEETRKLLEYCELEWDENCLNFHKNKRAIKTASSLQVRNKMYQGSSEAWKKYADQLKPLMNTLGYLS